MSNLTRSDLWAKGPYTLWDTGGGRWAVEDRDNDEVFKGKKENDAQFVCDALNAWWDKTPESIQPKEKQ